LLELKTSLRQEHVRDADLLGAKHVAIDEPGTADQQLISGAVVGRQNRHHRTDRRRGR
jgi:hypothetical protein